VRLDWSTLTKRILGLLALREPVVNTQTASNNTVETMKRKLSSMFGECTLYRGFSTSEVISYRFPYKGSYTEFFIAADK